MNTHTPGPWKHYDDSENSVHRHEIVALGKTVARIYCTNGAQIEDAANARLIAAAPDLLEALQEILEQPNYTWDKEKILQEVKRIAGSAIAKATGEQP
mgnify:CR=1 FL=1